jgi:hypothetical protein
MDSYRELGARTADSEVPDREAGLRFLEWLQEELLVLPTIVEGFMSYASLVICEGAMNALSREGCRHYEVFDQLDDSFEREIFKAEDPVVKQSAGALFDRMWGGAWLGGCQGAIRPGERACDDYYFAVVCCAWVCVVFAE